MANPPMANPPMANPPRTREEELIEQQLCLGRQLADNIWAQLNLQANPLQVLAIEYLKKNAEAIRALKAAHGEGKNG